MAERFTLSEATETLEVELGDGHVFAVKEITKHVESQLNGMADELQAQLDGAQKGAELVAAIGRYFDVVFKRIEIADGTRQAKPSTVLKKAWDANGLSIERLMALFAFVRTGVTESQDPPT